MKQRESGFTLIEVLIALAIMAIALVAVIKVSAQSVNSISHVKDKMAAHFVAMNVISEMQVGMIKLDKTSEEEGISNMLGRVWSWKIKIVKGGSDAVYERVKVSVMPLHQTDVYDIVEGFVRLTSSSSGKYE